MSDGYHHGDLRAELLRRTAEVIDRAGVDEVSLRALARDAGVSHAAPRHHFATREALLTALAAEGFGMLAERLRAAAAAGPFVEVGVAYAQFAAEHPAHFDVMFHPDLLDRDDRALAAAQEDAFGVLRAGVEAMAVRGAVGDAAAAVVAGWSLVHGLATLAATGNLDAAHLRALMPEPDLPSMTRRTAGMLFGSPPQDAR